LSVILKIKFVMSLRLVGALKCLVNKSPILQCSRTMANGSSGMGDLGSGSGKSGGSGGAVREAGGAFGKLEAAREEEYFHRRNLEQLKKLRAMQQDVSAEIQAIEAMQMQAKHVPDIEKSPEEKDMEKRIWGVS